MHFRCVAPFWFRVICRTLSADGRWKDQYPPRRVQLHNYFGSVYRTVFTKTCRPHPPPQGAFQHCSKPWKISCMRGSMVWSDNGPVCSARAPWSGIIFLFQIFSTLRVILESQKMFGVSLHLRYSNIFSTLRLVLDSQCFSALRGILDCQRMFRRVASF